MKTTTTALTILLSINIIIAQQTVNKTLIYSGETREYLVYIPESYQKNSPMPLLFNFHGGSGDIASQLAIADMRPIADTAGFIVVYPQAFPDPNDKGSTNWTHKPPTNHDDIFFVEAMIDTLSAEFVIDNNKVYACGYSNGGEFTFELACRLSNRIAAIGVVARSMYIDTYNQCVPLYPTAVVSIHGTKDDYNGLEWAGITYYISLDTVNNFWSNFNNTDPIPEITQLADLDSTDGSTVEHYKWNNGTGCISVEHFKIINGGHDWPGSFGNMDIDATEEIWKFVSQYDIDGLVGCRTTSVQEISNKGKEIAIYPNPSKGLLIFETKRTGSFDYQIYSVIGELKLSGTINLDLKIIDLSHLPSSIYFFKVGNRITKLVKI